MNYTFKDYVSLMHEVDIKKLITLNEIIESLKKYKCRGDINIVDNKNEIICQTHYEQFKIYFTPEVIRIERYNAQEEVRSLELKEALDHTEINMNHITDFEINDTSLRLKGKINDSLEISLFATFLDKNRQIGL